MRQIEAEFISIHAPPRGATIVKKCEKGLYRFQFTPLREGRPAPLARLVSYLFISIHAPPRGATKSLLPCLNKHGFQFTPLREGRRGHVEVAQENPDFNSRPSARGDSRRPGFRASGKFQFTPLREGRPPSPPAALYRTGISIHAPPRGATTTRTGNA